jgi:RNA polymerase sigma factor (sigma-70 family)
MQNAPETRLSLLLRLGDWADENAWAEFLEIYQPVVLQLAQRQGLQEADAHDLVQTMFSRVAKKASNWQTDLSNGTFRGWLAITTRNLVIDHFRRQQRQPASITDSHLFSLSSGVVDDEFDMQERRMLFQWAAKRCRSEFTEKTWEAFWLTSVDDQPVATVSKQLSMTAGAIYIARSRVLAKIRSLIESTSFDSSLSMEIR